VERIQPFDLVIFLGLLAMFVVGYAQGVIRRLLGIGAILFSLILGALLRPTVGGYLANEWTTIIPQYSFMVGFGAVFVAAAVTLSIGIQISYRPAPLFPKYPVLDELLGGLLGVLEGFLFLVAFLLITDPYFTLPNVQDKVGIGEFGLLRTIYEYMDPTLVADVLRPSVTPINPAIPGLPFPHDRPGPPCGVPRGFLGALLVRDARDGPAGPGGRRVARIVGVEAYVGEDDQASHARFGRTPRNAVMYGPPGIAYVYLVYGVHECLNVVTELEDRPAAVLIRAVDPVDERSAEALRRARWTRWRDRHPAAQPSELASEVERLRAVPDPRIASGPGLVAAGFGLSRADTGRDLLDKMSTVRIEQGAPPPPVVSTRRIGIGYATEPWRSLPWRFIDAGSRAVSGARLRGSAS